MPTILPSAHSPTEKELAILQVLWEKGPSNVRQVVECLGGTRQNGYTTILKILQIMYEKGLVTRQKSGKLHLYKAVPTQEKTALDMVLRLRDSVFHGSSARLALSALGSSNPSKEEMAEIRRFLDQLDGDTR